MLLVITYYVTYFITYNQNQIKQTLYNNLLNRL